MNTLGLFFFRSSVLCYFVCFLPPLLSSVALHIFSFSIRTSFIPAPQMSLRDSSSCCLPCLSSCFIRFSSLSSMFYSLRAFFLYLCFFFYFSSSFLRSFSSLVFFPSATLHIFIYIFPSFLLLSLFPLPFRLSWPSSFIQIRTDISNHKIWISRVAHIELTVPSTSWNSKQDYS